MKRTFEGLYKSYMRSGDPPGTSSQTFEWAELVLEQREAKFDDEPSQIIEPTPCPSFPTYFKPAGSSSSGKIPPATRSYATLCGAKVN